MRKLNQNEMLKINAGGVSGAVLTAIWKGVNIFTDIGRYFGSSLRRLVDKKLCVY